MQQAEMISALPCSLQNNSSHQTGTQPQHSSKTSAAAAAALTDMQRTNQSCSLKPVGLFSPPFLLQTLCCSLVIRG